jgi:hypothetical protein
MAIDLIHPDPTVHMYRHDLELIFYVLVWITSRFHDVQEIAHPPLQEWADNDDLLLVEKKGLSLCPCLPDEQNNFESFGCCIIFMQAMFHDGLWARSRYIWELSVGPQTSSPVHFVNDTLGGFVTFDKFQTSLDASLP